MHGDSLEIDELVVRFQVRRRYLYLWVAVSRLTRQVISFFLGDRSIGSLHALWQRVPREYRRKLIYTDAYAVYAEFFAAWQHRPSRKGSGRTSVAEGLNNKWRNRIAGLVRRTVCVRAEADVVRRLVLTFDQHNRLCRRRIEKLAWFTPSMQ
jgi:insertion element IS1 protein InsB